MAFKALEAIARWSSTSWPLFLSFSLSLSAPVSPPQCPLLRGAAWTALPRLTETGVGADGDAPPALLQLVWLHYCCFVFVLFVLLVCFLLSLSCFSFVRFLLLFVMFMFLMVFCGLYGAGQCLFSYPRPLPSFICIYHIIFRIFRKIDKI